MRAGGLCDAEPAKIWDANTLRVFPRGGRELGARVFKYSDDEGECVGFTNFVICRRGLRTPM
jgi:hypothetical protein